MRSPSWVDKYRAVLADAGFRSVLLPGLAIKLPVVAIPVALTLPAAVGLGLGFGKAGLLVGTWTLGVAVGSPVQGWVVDRHGLRPVLVIAAVAQAGFWVFAWRMPYPVLLAGAAVSGLTLVSGSTVMRLAVTGLLPEEIRHTAFAVDSVTTEVAYMAGPALCVLAATELSVRAATTGIGVLLGCGAAALAVRPLRVTAVPPGVGEGQRPSLRSVIRLPLLAALAMTAAASLVVAGYEVSIVASLRHLGDVTWSGLVLAACGVYSLVGGVVFGALPAPSAHRPGGRRARPGHGSDRARRGLALDPGHGRPGHRAVRRCGRRRRRRSRDSPWRVSMPPSSACTRWRWPPAARWVRRWRASPSTPVAPWRRSPPSAASAWSSRCWPGRWRGCPPQPGPRR